MLKDMIKLSLNWNDLAFCQLVGSVWWVLLLLPQSRRLKPTDKNFCSKWTRESLLGHFAKLSQCKRLIAWWRHSIKVSIALKMKIITKSNLNIIVSFSLIFLMQSSYIVHCLSKCFFTFSFSSFWTSCNV